MSSLAKVPSLLGTTNISFGLSFPILGTRVTVRKRVPLTKKQKREKAKRSKKGKKNGNRN